MLCESTNEEAQRRARAAGAAVCARMASPRGCADMAISPAPNEHRKAARAWPEVATAVAAELVAAPAGAVGREPAAAGSAQREGAAPCTDLLASLPDGAFVEVLASILDQICQSNEPLARAKYSGEGSGSRSPRCRFRALRPPSISVHDYLERLMTYSGCSSSCFVLALVYLDRLIQNSPGLFVSTFNVHRLLIASGVVAAKFVEDAYYDNNHWARMGGIGLPEMNALETELLLTLGFELYVAPDVYRQYEHEIYEHASRMYAQTRVDRAALCTAAITLPEDTALQQVPAGKMEEPVERRTGKRTQRGSRRIGQ